MYIYRIQHILYIYLLEGGAKGLFCFSPLSIHQRLQLVLLHGIRAPSSDNSPNLHLDANKQTKCGIKKNVSADSGT